MAITTLIVFILLIIGFIAYLIGVLEDERRVSKSRQKIIDELLENYQHREELQLWILAMIASDCKVEEIKEYLKGL